MTNTFSVFGLNFMADSQKRVREEIAGLPRANSAKKKSATSVIFANAHVVVECSRNDELRELLAKADYVVPDGTPIAWVLKAKGQNQAQRYSGPDFMEDIFREVPQARHFFLGSTPETLRKIQKKFKGNTAGFYSPPFVKGSFSPEEKQKQLNLVAQAKADFIWVGLGAPKQERYVTEMASLSAHGVWCAVGAAFDFYAENKPRSPRLLQTLGLEWAFRLASEPKRLAGRYFSTNPTFIKLALGELLRPCLKTGPKV